MIPLLLVACAWVTKPEYEARLDVDRDGVMWPEDCDDRDPAVFPGAIERCDGVDNDCDGQGDAGAEDAAVWYADLDGDGRGDPNNNRLGCGELDRFVADSSDCDDTNPEIFPGAAELCDGVDNDCDGAIDGPDALGGGTWYPDGDGDGFGDSSGGLTACEPPSGYVLNSGDCDDSARDINPDAPEVCNDFIDNDCSGGAPECRLVGEGPIADIAVRLNGEGGAFGRALLGELDLNADGFDDLVVGVPEDGGFAEGSIYAFLGPISRDQAEIPLSDADLFIRSTVSDGAFGTSLASPGDLDGDGLPELAVGITGLDTSVYDDGGGLIVLRGEDLLNSTLGSPRLTAYGATENDLAGAALIRIGDLTSDNLAELAVSAPYNNDYASNAGSVCMVRGSSTGTLNLRGAGGCLRGAAAEDRLGESLAPLGDFDGEGADSYIIGSPRHGSAGAAWVVTEMRTNFDNVSDELPIFGAEESESFGASVAGAGDLDGDGYDDAAIGAPGNHQGGDAAGAVYLVRGRLIENETMPSDLADLDPIVLVGESTGDNVGSVASARDFDQDGATDLLVAAPDKASDDALDAGRVYLVYGPLDTPGTYALAEAPLRLDGGVDYEEVGRTLTPAGDLDADGYPDLAVGAPTDAGEYPGAVYLLFGSGM